AHGGEHGDAVNAHQPEPAVDEHHHDDRTERVAAAEERAEDRRDTARQIDPEHVHHDPDQDHASHGGEHRREAAHHYVGSSAADLDAPLAPLEGVQHLHREDGRG